MSRGRTFLSGMIGAAIMSVMLLLVRAMGMPASLELMLGTVFLRPGDGAFLLGLVLHLVVGGFLALVYGWVFESLTRRAGLGPGAALGVGHALVAGLALGVVPDVHPLVPEIVRAPGPFMSNLGPAGIAVFILTHIVYGAIVGALAVPAARRVGI